MEFRTIEDKEFVDIIFTDIQFHVVKPRKPVPLSRAIARSIRNDRPGRAYTTNFSIKKDGRFQMAFPTPPELEKVISNAESKGKMIRFMLPKEGIPVFAGKDTIENIISKTERRGIGKNA